MNEQSHRSNDALARQLAEVLERYRSSQREGASREVLQELEGLRSQIDPESAAEYAKIEIAIASIEDELGLTDEARHRLMACREIARRADPLDQCRLAYYWGFAAIREDRFAEASEAIDYYDEALARVDGTTPRATLHYDLLRAVIAERTLDLGQAADGFRRCAQVSEVGSHMWSSSRCGLVRIAIMEFRFDDALLILDGLLQLQDELGGHATAHNYSLKANALVGTLRIDEAIETAEKAIEMTRERGLFRAAAESALTRTIALWHRGDSEAVQGALAEGVSLNVADVNREFAALLKAWLEGAALPEVNENRALALREFLENGATREAVTDPTHVAIAALVADREPGATYEVDRRRLRVDGADHDLSRRGALRRVLERLLDDRDTGDGVETVDLFDAGWPEVEEVGPNGFRRVYTEIYRLRDMGLEIASLEGGYRLETAVETV